MKDLLRFLLYTSLFAAVCAVALCMATERLVLQHIPPLCTPLHALAFGGTLLVYNVHSIARQIMFPTPPGDDSALYPGWKAALGISGLLLCGVSILFMSRRFLEVYALLALLSFAYSLPLLPIHKKRKRLKDFGYVKIFVLTGVWTVATSVLPIVYWGHSPALFPFEIALRFVFMFALCMAFDVRDMQSDLEARIFTLPNRIGLSNSYLLMFASLVLFAVLSVFQYLRYPSPTRLGGEILASAYAGWAILYTRKHPSDFSYLLFVDGAMLLYGVAVLWH